MLTVSTKLNALSQRLTLKTRGAIALLALFAEKPLLESFVNVTAAQSANGAGYAFWFLQHWGFRVAVSTVVALIFFTSVSGNERFDDVNDAARAQPVHLGWLLAHVVTLGLAALSLTQLYGASGIADSFWIKAVLSSVLVASATGFLVASLAPLPLWRQGTLAIGARWLYILSAAAVATVAIQWSQMLWRPTSALTFILARGVLLPFIPHLYSDPQQLILGTERFSVQVTAYCSGLEGIGLMLAFSGAWLLYFRKEYAFPRALLLLPISVVLIFGLNALRIAGLVLVGHSGYAEVAEFGFHSQAGWIAFNAAACAIAFGSRHIGWFLDSSERHIEADSASAGDNPAAAYLMPLLALLATGMLTRAASAGFDTPVSHWIRLIACAGALFAFRRMLSELDWRFSWRGVSVGVAVFALWFGAARLLLPEQTLPTQLAAMPDGPRAVWLVGRLIVSVLAVPVAEELAYRAYLMRRLIGADFTAVRFCAVGIWALLLSSVIFGAAHGTMWAAAVLTGILYGGLLIRSGKIGEAVAAHATTNGLIAACVLFWQQWQLW